MISSLPDFIMRFRIAITDMRWSRMQW